MTRSVSLTTDKLWQRIDRYIELGQAAPARAALESLLTRAPTDTKAHLMLGGLCATEGHHRAATRQALAAARVDTGGDAKLLGDTIAALIKVGEIVEARRLLALPVIADSASTDVLMRAALHQQLIGEHAAALALIAKAGAAGARDRNYHFYRATQLAFNGDKHAARSELEHCIAIDPPLGQAYAQLVTMDTQTASENHLAAIEAALQKVEPRSESHAALEFAHYKEVEDLHHYDAAWQSLAHANATMHARMGYDAQRETALFARLIDACTAKSLAATARQSESGPCPIFVIGMPRSGTTVLERILGSHSQVTSAGELGDFASALAQATDHLAQVMLDEMTIERLDAIDWNEVGRRYLAQTGWRARGKPFFVDKLPRNWMLAGLIHKALPRSRILHVVRDPMDVCFSNWRAYLGGGPEFAYAYDFDALASHYRQYRKVMAHWHAAMPGVVLDVNHARLVHDTESVVREVMAFCGLDFEPDCLDLTQNTSPCATLSTLQVREPLHVRTSGQWRPYASRLAHLRDALEATTIESS